MKKKLINYLVGIFLAAVYLLACAKESVEEIPQHINIDSLLMQSVGGAYPANAVECFQGPVYKDSIVYKEPGLTADYLVAPVNNPGPGRYYSWPKGMILDSLTGSINVSKSEVGLRYVIGYVKEGTRDTCLQQLVLAGASYIDSIYILGNAHTMAYPYFDANRQTGSICVPAPGEDDYDSDGNDKCRFKASNSKLKIGSITGTLDLKKSLEQGIFGSRPVNGQTVKVRIDYRLNDRSGKSLQQMHVQLIYYNTKSEIPKSLVDFVASKSLDATAQMLITPGRNPRPPLIIITRS